ncbi:MAG TPA: hypothetical protein VMT00_02530 [Thermoanaerobaculia bacterium]|nr:hypothetical protein [Thermoanaerobaculia bacterium]
MRAIHELLEETAARGELHHAIILHGPSHEVMQRLAVRLAQRLICPLACPDASCLSCSRVAREIHPDFHRVAVGAERKLIAIEQIRELVSEATLRPYEGRSKVFLIEAAETMSLGASNALLKTLEEPVPDTSFILLARSAGLLLPTIRSRCQALYIGPERSEPAPAESLQQDRLLRDAPLFGEASADVEPLSLEIIGALHDFARQGETSALLALAARLAEGENGGDQAALLATILRDFASLTPEDSIDPEASRIVRNKIGRAVLLDSARDAIAASKRLAVNADPRMLFEQILLGLAPPRRD